MKRKLRKITKANITHISFVPKGANGQDFLIVKSNDLPDLICESPILKLDEEKHLVTGVVYTPDVVDSQGEFMEADAIEKAAHDFMESSRQMDEKHNFVTNDAVAVVESYIAKSDTEVEGQTIKKGTWLITAKVNDEKLWDAVKKGEYKGFSMGGTGIREEVQAEENEKTIKKDEQGLFAVLKGFFTGEAVEKEEKAGITDFKVLAVGRKIDESRWALQEAICNILHSDAENKKELVGAQIDSYKDYILSQMDSAGIEKMQKEFDSIEKAGKSLSAANAGKIKEAYESLGELILLMEKDPQRAESEESMKKEELQAIVKEVVQPLEKRLESLEKEGDDGNEELSGILKKEELAEVIKEAMKPLSERLEKVEKSRGISRQLEDEEGIEKDGSREFASVEI